MNISHFRKITEPFRKIQGQHFIVLLLINLSSILLAYFMGKTVDSLVAFQRLAILIMLIIGLRFASAYLKYRQSLLEKSAQLRVHYLLGKSIPQKLARIPYELFEDARYQDLFHFVNKEPEKILLRSLFNINRLGAFLLEIVLIFILLSRVSPYLLLILPFCLAMIICMDFKGIKYYNDMYYRQSRREREQSYYQGLLNKRDDFYGLKTRNALSYITAKMKLILNDILRERFMIVIKRERYFFFSMLFIVFALASVLSFLILNLIRGSVSPGLAVATLLLLPNLLSSLETFGYLLTLLGENMGVLKRYNEFLNLPEINFMDKDIGSLKDGFSIRFEKVWFKYPNSKNWVIKDMSFKIEQGDKLGLVGKNGSGKSTLMYLILGLYKAQKGKIYFNEIPVDTLTYKELSQLIAVVFQDFHHYELNLQDQFRGKQFAEVNILDNIAQDEEEFQRIKIGRSLKDGIELSGGQWQKITLTRALLADNPLLVLDEPTSAIDPIAEKNLYDDFGKLIDTKRTSIMVSHRMNSLRTCNKIMIIDEGKLLGMASHDELLKVNSLYEKMYWSQMKWYKTEEGENHDEKIDLGL